MSCPPQSLYGFVNLTKTPSSDDLNSIAINTYPFIMNFAARSTPLTLPDNSTLLTEDAANTIMFKGNIYTLANTQICNPSSGSYNIYGTLKPTKATLIYTYFSQTTNQAVTSYQSAIQQNTKPPFSNQPLIILLIVPIYTGTPSANATYLRQLLPTITTEATYPTLETLLKGLKSIGYSACIDLQLIQNASTPFGIPTNIYNFTDGITLSEGDWTTIIGPRIITPYNLTGQDPKIVQSYNVDNGQWLANTTNMGTGFAILPLMTVAKDSDSDFIKKLRYYTQPATSSLSTTAAKTNLTPNQYQCLPFDQLKNLQTDPNGITTVTLDKIIKNNDMINGTVGYMISWQQLQALWIPIVVCFSLFFLLWGALYIFSSETEALPKATTVSTGTVPTAPA
jgi:hypothetical protein